MVSETFKPARKERKNKATSAAELQKKKKKTKQKRNNKVHIQSKYRLKTQKVYKRLKQTLPIHRLYQKTPQMNPRDHGKLQPSNTSYGLD